MRKFDSTPIAMNEYRRPLQQMPPMERNWHPSWGECKPARFAVQILHKGRVTQVHRPNLARSDRENVRLLLQDIIRDAKRFGDIVRIARVIEG